MRVSASGLIFRGVVRIIRIRGRERLAAVPRGGKALLFRLADQKAADPGAAQCQSGGDPGNDAIAVYESLLDGPPSARIGRLRGAEPGSLRLDSSTRGGWESQVVQSPVERAIEGTAQDQSENSDGQQAGNAGHRIIDA